MHPAPASTRPATRLLFVALLSVPLGFLALAAAGASYALAIAGGTTLAVAAAVSLRDAFGGSSRAREWRQCFLIWLALFAWLTWVHRTGRYVYGQDVLLIPGIAQTLTDAPLPRDSFGPTEPGRVYPPGFAILSSPAALLLRGPQQLALWSFVTQASQAALPVLWASVLKRWFALPLDRFALAVILAGAMLGLERTAVLGGSIKNAQHVALGVILPTLLILLPRGIGWRKIAASILLIGAMTTFYYMMLHVFIAIVAGWLVSDVWLRRRVAPRTLRRVVALAGATLVVGASFVWLVSGLGDDPRLPDPGLDFSERLWRTFIDPTERFWFIFGFMRPDFIGSGTRRSALLLSLALCVSLPPLVGSLPSAPRRMVDGLHAVAGLALGMAIACLVLVAMVLMAPGTRLGVAFARWLLSLPQLILLAAPFLSLAVVLRALGRPRAVVVGVPLGMLVLAGGIAHGQDALRVRERALQRGVSLRGAEVLAQHLRQGSPCLVVAESTAILKGYFHVGADPLSDVVDVVSPCRLTGGSFIRNPLPGGRASSALPEGRALAEWQRTHILWAIGGDALIEELSTRQPALTWREVAAFGDGRSRLWRAEASSAAQR